MTTVFVEQFQALSRSANKCFELLGIRPEDSEGLGW